MKSCFQLTPSQAFGSVLCTVGMSRPLWIMLSYHGLAPGTVCETAKLDYSYGKLAILSVQTDRVEVLPVFGRYSVRRRPSCWTIGYMCLQSRVQWICQSIEGLSMSKRYTLSGLLLGTGIVGGGIGPYSPDAARKSWTASIGSRSCWRKQRSSLLLTDHVLKRDHSFLDVVRMIRVWN